MSNVTIVVKVKPKRVQRKRTRGWRMPPGCKYVGRPTEYGNPFVPGRRYFFTALWVVIQDRALTQEEIDTWYRDKGIFVRDAAHAVELYRRYADWRIRRAAGGREWIEQLRGLDLGCWCSLDQPCHADVLLELANRPRRLA